MGTLNRIAWAAIIVADAGAFLPAPGRVPTESTSAHQQQQTRWFNRDDLSGAITRKRRCEVAPAVAHGSRSQSLSVLHARKKGKKKGLQQYQQEEYGQEDEEELGDEDRKAMEEFRLSKLEEWKSMMQSGEVRIFASSTNPQDKSRH